MSEFTEIIMQLLWRFYPIAWLTTIILRALSSITEWLEDEETRFELACDKDRCARIGGWLALAEERLNELIVMKAMRVLKRRWRPPDPCPHAPARAVRSPEEILRRLTRLVVLYHDHKRLYEKRARMLARLFAQAELELEVVHHPVDSTTTTIFVARGSTRLDSTTTIFHSLGSRPDSRIRAPPRFDLNSANPAPSQPAGVTRETESSCPTSKRRVATNGNPAGKRFTCANWALLGTEPLRRSCAVGSGPFIWRSLLVGHSCSP